MDGDNEVGVAVGVLMAQRGVSRRVAFETSRQHARRSRLRLSVAASEIASLATRLIDIPSIAPAKDEKVGDRTAKRSRPLLRKAKGNPAAPIRLCHLPACTGGANDGGSLRRSACASTDARGSHRGRPIREPRGGGVAVAQVHRDNDGTRVAELEVSGQSWRRTPERLG